MIYQGHKHLHKQLGIRARKFNSSAGHDNATKTILPESSGE